MTDRERLRSWLGAPSRTWRWNRGSTERYDAVEATNATLRWFRWSHDLADGGMTFEKEQSVESFLANGAPPEMEAPASVLTQLNTWLSP